VNIQPIEIKAFMPMARALRRPVCPGDKEYGMIRTYFDEMYDAGGQVRPHYRDFARWLADTPDELLAQRRREADLLFHRAGITFTLYGDEQGTERLIPFDTIPRSIPASEWRVVERGCIQRVKALNMFLADLYHEQRIIKAGIIPAEQVLANEQYQLAMQGWICTAISIRTSPASIWCAMATAPITCSKTTCAHRAASATCSKTAR
jgi:uncharacterized circularly permuted ATP-grasp superfamily protein